MKKIRKEGENLEEMLKELKVGDCPILDSATGYEIVKVPNGYIYKNEYIGMVFVPDVESRWNYPKIQLPKQSRKRQ